MTQVIEKIGGEYENRTRVHGFARSAEFPKALFNMAISHLN
jgi:hypothetical protein